jgi:hypothetical protein
MASRDELFELSERFALPVLTIDELIAWRKHAGRPRLVPSTPGPAVATG